MQNRSDKNRPLHYNHRVDMHSFVYGNPSQAYSVNIPHAMAPPRVQHPVQQTSLFDRYNRQNLYLRDCDERDVIQLSKNVVVHQEPLTGQFADNVARKTELERSRSSKNKKQASASKMPASATQDRFLKTAPQPVPTREYIQNETFFNYKQMGDIKRKQKQEYLSAIEQMVRDAEQQISQIEELREEQKLQMIHVAKQQRNNHEQVDAHYRIGMMTQQLGSIEPEQEEELLHIHQEMNPREINEILDDHHRLNEDILEMASRARSKEGKAKLAATNMSQKLGNTLKKAMGPPKSMASTTKDGFKGRKGKK